MSETDIVFEDPGPPYRSAYDWSGIAEKLRKNPNQWGKVFDEDLVSRAEAVRQNRISALRREAGFESRTRNNRRTTDPETGKVVRTCSLYVRYVAAKDTNRKRRK